MLLLVGHYIYYYYEVAAVMPSVRYNPQCCTLPEPVVPVSLHVSPRRTFIALIRYDLPDPAVPVMIICSGSTGLHYLVVTSSKDVVSNHLLSIQLRWINRLLLWSV